MKYEFLTYVMLVTIIGCATVNETSLESTEIYSITVDYSRTIEDLLLVSNYKWVHPEITTKRFPSTETGMQQLTLILAELPRSLTVEKVIDYQKQRQFRPATIKEMLAFAHQYPRVQLEYSIVCLGSTCSFYAQEKSTSETRTFGMQTSTKLPRSDQKRLQTFWPLLDSQGKGRILDLGQLSQMRQNELQTYWGCFVGIN